MRRAASAREDIVANCDYVGDGYGLPTEAMNDAVMLLARQEGLLFDPVYSGKGTRRPDRPRAERVFSSSADSIVFVHTGGVAGLFGYSEPTKPLTERQHLSTTCELPAC